MEKKPNVFPKKSDKDITQNRSEDYDANKIPVINEIYKNSISPDDTPEGHVDAIKEMANRTKKQLEDLSKSGVVKESDLLKEEKLTNQIKLRNEQLNKNIADTKKFNDLTNDAYNRNKKNIDMDIKPPSSKPPIVGIGDNENDNNSDKFDGYVLELSQPDFNAPFDLIPLPSKGKLYNGKKSAIKIAFMTTADENILSSPNLLQSGDFLEILINRKILEPGLRYKDLHVGDRNAIMLWLRATSYGEMYPITLLDGKNEPFSAEINLNDLRTVELGAEPDENGLFDFTFKLSKKSIKFKLLSCGDVDSIDRLVEKDTLSENPLNKQNSYKLEHMIVSVDGDTDKNNIKSFISSLRIKDGDDFKKYVDSIESGVDLNLEVWTPGGESIKTFLPLNLSFFWPNL